MEHGIGAHYEPTGNTKKWARIAEGDSGSAWWQNIKGYNVIIATTNGLSAYHSTGARVSKYIPWIKGVYNNVRLLSNVVNPDNSQAILYSDDHYHGDSIKVTDDLPWIGDDFNDKLSSIKVPKGWSVTLYEDINYQGNAITLTHDSDFLSNFNDLTSSLRISKHDK